MQVQLRPSELPGLLEGAPASIRWLSLDCFDTLLWRDTATPADVFADLTLPGGAIEPRRRSEDAARQAAKLFKGSMEVSIEEIHARFRPGGDVAGSVAEELAAEARHCFGFAPIMTLIRQAKERGLGVIIVSDTYLSEAQLRDLIAAAAGAETAAMIDHVFASSAHGVNKADGLFTPVLEAIAADPAEILHLGDNRIADQVAPAELGLHTAHLLQFDDAAKARLRLEAAASALIHPAARVTEPCFQPHRPLVSLRTDNEAAFALGHDVIGPLLMGFAAWLQDERAAVASQTGRRTHLLFLLRDGFLPAEIYDILFPDADAKRVEISRQTAARASAINEAAIRFQLVREGRRNKAEVLARQFHFSRDEIARVAPADAPAAHPKFVERVTRPGTVAQIASRSARFADRLIAHLKRAGVEQGDAVIFADLGYHGTVQDLVGPMLAEHMNLHVAGRYLLLREEAPSGLDKRGYLDARHYDFRTLDALCDPIAVVEQLCTIAQGSVVDYKWGGSPVRKDAGIKSHQSATRDRVQDGCRAFANASSAPADANAWRVGAAAALARLLFLPTEQEVDVLQSFDHDVNLGTSELVKLIDPEAATAGLRDRGLPYLMHAKRMFIPGEIRGAGLPLNLSMLAWRRFGLELTTGDMNGTALSLPVIVADATSETVIPLDAFPTHDGYYALAVPVGAGRYTIGVQWGGALDWVQIQSARFSVIGDHAESKAIEALTIHEGMECAADGLYHCTGGAAFTLIPPPAVNGAADLLLHIVFRPIVRRAEAVQAAQAA